MNIEPVTEPNKRRPRRTKAVVDESIIKAAEAEILENGFSDALVSNIVKRAKIEPRVFYLRYKDLKVFYDSFVKRYDYWFSELLKGLDANEVSAKSLKAILTSLIENLNQESVMLELLRWEVANGNEITKRTAMLREFHTINLAHEYDHVFRSSGIDIVAVSTLLIAGIYYLTLHKDRATFCGIDLKTEEGIRRLEEAMGWLVDKLFELKSEIDNKRSIAEKLRQHGISEDIIADCLG